MSTESDLSLVFSAEAAIEKNFLKPQSSFFGFTAHIRIRLYTIHGTAAFKQLLEKIPVPEQISAIIEFSEKE